MSRSTDRPSARCTKGRARKSSGSPSPQCGSASSGSGMLFHGSSSSSATLNSAVGEVEPSGDSDDVDSNTENCLRRGSSGLEGRAVAMGLAGWTGTRTAAGRAAAARATAAARAAAAGRCAKAPNVPVAGRGRQFSFGLLLAFVIVAGIGFGFGIRLQDLGSGFETGTARWFDFVTMLCGICDRGANFRGGIVWLPHHVTPHVIASPNPSSHI